MYERSRFRPPRPSLPFLLLPGAGVWVGVVIGERRCWNLLCLEGGEEASLLLRTGVFACALLAFILCLCVSLFSRPSSSIHTLCIAGTLLSGALLLGLLAGTLCWSALARDTAELVDMDTTSYELEVISDPKVGTYQTTSTGIVRLADDERLAVRIIWKAPAASAHTDSSADKDDGGGWETDEGTGGRQAAEQDAGGEVAGDKRGGIPPLGSLLTVRASLAQGGSYDMRRFLHRQGIASSLTVYAIEERGWADSLRGLLGPWRLRCCDAIDAYEGVGDEEGAALLKGVLLGYRCDMDGREIDQEFEVTGLSHLIAVSGSHLLVVVVIISWVLKRLSCGHLTLLLILSALLVVYVTLTGLQASALRACCMTIIATMTWFTGRRRHAPSALVAAVILMLLIQPTNAFSVGFQLSVCATLALCLFTPLVREWLLFPCVGEKEHTRVEERRRHPFATRIADPLALTLTAQAGTFPVAVPLFATYSLVGPLANLLVAPAISLLIGGGLLVLVVLPLFPPLASFLIGALCVCAQGTCWLVGILAAIPHASVPFHADAWLAFLLAVLVAGALWVSWPRPRKRSIAVLLLTSLTCVAIAFSTPFGHAGEQVVMLDVGQGDAFLICDTGAVILVDTGDDASALLAALARQGVDHLDAVFITHLDADHCGALEALAGSVVVDRVILAAGTEAVMEQGGGQGKVTRSLLKRLVGGEGVTEVRAGDRITLGAHMEVDILWPQSTVLESDNEESLAFALLRDGDGDGKAEAYALFTGDAEAPVVRAMLAGDEALTAAMSQAFTVLKVPHHGSKAALDEELLAQLAPDLALISVGADNRYGHPAASTMALLEAHGVRVYRSDGCGDVSVRFSGSSCRVLCENGAEREDA